MIIVYGIRRKVKTVKNLGKGVCCNCGHEVSQILAKECGHAHVYYIPVFPLLNGIKFIGCPICGISRLVSKEEFKAIKTSTEE